MKTRLPTHIPALDGLRGIAVILVVLFHIWLGVTTRNPSLPFLHLFAFGWIGVDIFFVISGFLITSILLQTKGSDKYLRDFYTRRAARIIPPYYGLLLVVTIGVMAFPNHATGDFIFLRENLLWLWIFLHNFVTATTHTPFGYGLNHLWSLAVEVQFYAAWPLLVLWLHTSHLRTIALIAVIACLVARCFVWVSDGSFFSIYFATFCRLDSLAIGALVALTLRNGISRQSLKRCVSFGMVVGSTGFAWLTFVQGAQPIESYAVFAISAVALFSGATVAMIVADLWPSIWKGALELPPLRYVGQISYGLYVYHFPILFLLDKVVTRLGLEFVYGSVGGALLFSAVYISLSFVVAALSWHFLESRLKKWFVPNAASSRRHD